MILRVAYTGNDLQFLESIENVVKNYPLVRIESYCRDQHLTQKDYYKLMGHYGTRASRLMVLLDNDQNVIQPFYVEDKTCTPDYLKIVLDHWVLYNPIENGYSGDKEAEG